MKETGCKKSVHSYILVVVSKRLSDNIENDVYPLDSNDRLAASGLNLLELWPTIFTKIFGCIKHCYYFKIIFIII